jgi:hypothetical protein
MDFTIIHDVMNTWWDVVDDDRAIICSPESTTNKNNNSKNYIGEGVDMSFVIESEALSGRKGIIQGHTVQQTYALLNQAPLLLEPIIGRESGTVTLYVDSELKVTRVEMKCDKFGY